MRSVVCCDVINSLASVIHNGRPQRCAGVPSLRFWHGPSRSIFLSIYLSPICLPICLCSPSKFRYSSHTNANSLTHSMRAWMWIAANHEHFFLSSALTHFSLCYRVFLAQLFAALWVTSYLSDHSRQFYNVPLCQQFGVDNAVSALTRPVIKY